MSFRISTEGTCPGRQLHWPPLWRDHRLLLCDGISELSGPHAVSPLVGEGTGSGTLFKKSSAFVGPVAVFHPDFHSGTPPGVGFVYVVLNNGVPGGNRTLFACQDVSAVFRLFPEVHLRLHLPSCHPGPFSFHPEL